MLHKYLHYIILYMMISTSSTRNTIMTNYGYLLKKVDTDPKLLENIRNDLTVKPIKKTVKYSEDKEPFPIFQEGNAKLLLPKYYGLEYLGEPSEIKTTIDSLFVGDNEKYEFNGTLRDYQEPIIEKAKERFFNNDGSLRPYGGGVITIPPGKGKTCLGLYLSYLFRKLSNRKINTLIVVHKTFLVNQWIERIRQYLPDAKIGIIQQDKIDIEGKDIVIGMLQSICLKNYDEDIFERFSFVIFDEVHHLGAKVFSNALLKIQAPFTLGLSATPTREDKLEKVFYWHLGSSIWEQYADNDNTVTIKMYNYNTSVPNKLLKPVFNFRTKQINMAKMVTNVTELEIRNQHIVNLITNEIFPIIPIVFNKLTIKKINKSTIFNNNLFDNLVTLSTEPILKFRKCLLLSNRIEHLKRIEKMLINHDHRWENLIGYYIGGMKEKKLKESEQKPLLLGTFEMASEGLDIADLDTIILGTPKSNITQSLGRMLRLQAHMRYFTPVAYDIVDNVSVFVAQGKKRYSSYVSKEYNVEWYDVVDTTIKQIENPFFMVYDSNNDQFIDSESEI
jgi:superfamily II DNA or RNA helicase